MKKIINILNNIAKSIYDLYLVIGIIAYTIFFIYGSFIGLSVGVLCTLFFIKEVIDILKGRHKKYEYRGGKLLIKE